LNFHIFYMNFVIFDMTREPAQRSGQGFPLLSAIRCDDAAARGDRFAT
jgi:hypothetical protein